ncbi:RHS repeat-associated core domain-containing protein [Cysteiniphilum sp. QT6929]|uniref:RHS repeat-associated core domain-containing protein n=1 Tax=Cysteiniphilum sp. QT6929 TaxID=2975055 RepID=UPI0024B390F1|nr:RHS repeat-associated core domain-containing protein [Cysteiniphilum sp. QT6929]WHN66535.1 RHS repeat-associated core domain-containing protein [Cysteiniphilum sp. QT6929]
MASTDEIIYTYGVTEPARLINYQHVRLVSCNQKVTFSYDQLGHLINDESGNHLRYNGLGQMVGFESARESVLSQYRYNGLAQQYQQQVYKDQQVDVVQLYYNNGQLYNELSVDGIKSYYYGEGLEAVLDNEGLLSYVSDQSHNVLMLAKVNNGQIVLSHNYVYSPYGISYDVNKSSQQVTLLTDNAIGFNGERTDRVSGYQHLGQGTRAYNPILHRFMQMDGVGYSPFGQGGLNGYAYGLNNPVMNFDPSGHFSFPSWLNYTLAGVGIAGALFSGGASLSLTGSAFAAAEFSAFLGLASGVSDIAVEATHGNNQTLNKVAFGLGVASIAFDLGTLTVRSLNAAGRQGLNHSLNLNRMSYAEEAMIEPMGISNSQIEKFRNLIDESINTMSLSFLPYVDLGYNNQIRISIHRAVKDAFFTHVYDYINQYNKDFLGGQLTPTKLTEFVNTIYKPENVSRTEQIFKQSRVWNLFTILEEPDERRYNHLISLLDRDAYTYIGDEFVSEDNKISIPRERIHSIYNSAFARARLIMWQKNKGVLRREIYEEIAEFLPKPY